MKAKLLVVGGFLGAGKTTSILSAANYLLDNGKKVGIVTNDQGSDLVDTNFLIQKGFKVLEVTGGCFCCNLDKFAEKLNQMSDDLPDYILAEPVGSCTDLVAAIFKPIEKYYKSDFSLLPLSVVVDPKRLKKIISLKSNEPLNELNYLFVKQLQESDVVLLNKIDTLSDEQIFEMKQYIENKFKGVEVIPISAKNKTGINQWMSCIANLSPNFHKLDIDYKAYTVAEQCLGWYNSVSDVYSNNLQEIDFNRYVKDLLNNIKNKLKESSNEIAHLKVYAINANDYLKASVTSVDADEDFSANMSKPHTSAKLIINARAAAHPEQMEQIISGSVISVTKKHNAEITINDTQSFVPSEPVIPKPIYL